MTLSQQLRGQRRRRRRAALVFLVVLALLVAGAVVSWTFLSGADERAARRAADDFAAAWSAGNLAQATYAEMSGKRAAAAYQRAAGDLHDASVRVTTEEVNLGDSKESGGTAVSAEFAVTWQLPGGPRWSYSTTAPLMNTQGTWAVRWSPSVIHPKLGRGERLVVDRTQPQRASILGREGRPLVTERPVVNIGVVPGKTSDPATTVAKLREILDIEAEGLEQRIQDAGPDIFVQVITLRQEDFAPLESRLRALSGVAWSEDTLPLAPTTEFARALLGRVGPVTAEVVEKSGGRYRAGDTAGLSGMQRQYDRRLAGVPGLRVLAAPVEGASAQTATLFTKKPTPGDPVRTTLDPDVQKAADAALADVEENSALVAVHVPSGDVLAVANGPDAGGYNRALRGRYPPGSTFKVASTLALLRDGLSVNETVPCPEYATVQGKSWHNFENFSLGSVPFRTDFAKSCNTAFIGLASRLGERDLTAAAASLGIGRPYHLGVPAFSGDVPRTTSKIDHAAAMIGQARVLASPVAMATAAATVARGSYTLPTLVEKPKPASDSAGDAVHDAKPLTEREASTLSELMRSVVMNGSGGAVADIPGKPVIAKTGTAEYGTANPPKTHVWMIGAQGDIAFSIFVENGNSGGQVAGPIAADFLRNLAP